VEVIAPRGDNFASELPIILPEVRGVITRPGGRVILDVGGDDVGARVLSAFASVLPADQADLLMVLNARRPFTDSVAGALKIMREIETASRLKVTGLVANTHLMDETTPETVREGIRAARELGAATGLPVRFCVMQRSVADAFGGAEDTAEHLPILTIERHIVAPFATPPPGACRRSRAV
jgi:hypothetical protein